ncbi:MAG: TonB family protein [Sphingomicrobium sp.]
MTDTMYRSDLNPRDKTGAITLVLAIHAGLAFALLHLSGTVDLTAPQRELQVFDVSDIVPPPEPPPVEKQVEQEKPKEKEGASAPKNIKSEATPVVAPKPRIELPVPPTIVVAEIPRQGSDPTQGAAPVRGPGTGAGGLGTGTGSGGSGSGSGGGGMGKGTRPRLVSRPLTSRDYPRELARAWPSGARVMVAVRVQLDGRGTDCRINGSSGVPAIDAETCRLAETKLRFRPAINARGEPYVAWYGYMQYPVNF